MNVAAAYAADADRSAILQVLYVLMHSYDDAVRVRYRSSPVSTEQIS